MNSSELSVDRVDETFSAETGFGVIRGSVAPASWDNIREKPFETVGDSLKVESGELSVNVTSRIEADNTKPVSSAAVYTEVGNVEILLGLI